MGAGAASGVGTAGVAARKSAGVGRLAVGRGGDNQRVVGVAARQIAAVVTRPACRVVATVRPRYAGAV